MDDNILESLLGRFGGRGLGRNRVSFGGRGGGNGSLLGNSQLPDLSGISQRTPQPTQPPI